MWRSKRCYIALLLFSTIFLGSFVNSSGDASAVADLTTVYNASNYPSSETPLFPTCNDSQCLSQYHYLSWTATGNYSPASNFPLKGFRGFNDVRIVVNGVYLIDGSTSLTVPGLYMYGSQEFTFTLTEFYPNQGCSSPSGILSITSNGTFDVSSYDYAEVDVPAPPVFTPYDGKLDSLIQAVYTVGAVMLVIYFFFALYRIYIGGKT